MADRPEFTYDAYRDLLGLLQENGYEVSDYDTWAKKKHPVILRHDIDSSIEKAAVFAHLEQELGVHSTYFVLLTTDFYNVFSLASTQKLREIMACGHEVGLHFDEMNYPEIVGNCDAIREKILQEASLLQFVTGKSVTKVSMHRPSKTILAADLQIPGMINSYSQTFFRDFKYLSDSRHRWREPALDVIKSRQYPRLHILTHAVGYGDTPTDLQQWVETFLRQAYTEKWDVMNRNFTDLSSVVPRDGGH